jgi:hypothetical protein
VDLRLRSDQTDVVFGCSHISQPVLAHLACCPNIRRLTISSAELMSVDLGALRFLSHLEVHQPSYPFLFPPAVFPSTNGVARKWADMGSSAEVMEVLHTR